MKKAILIPLTILLVNFVFLAANANFMRMIDTVYAANPTLTVHLTNTRYLTDKGIDVEAVKARMRDVFSRSGVDATITTDPPTYGPGHVEVIFLNETLRDHAGKLRTDMYGTRANHSGPFHGGINERITFVSVKTILDSFAYKNPTNAQKANLVALTALHEVGEVYLEDYDANIVGSHPWVMKSNNTEDGQWMDAQSPDLRFSELDGGGAGGIRKSDQENLRDRIPNDRTDFFPDDDMVGLITPSTPLLQPGSSMMCSLFGEGIVSPVSAFQMSFTAWQGGSVIGTHTTYTLDDGTASYDVPVGATKLDTVAYNGELTYAELVITDVVGGFVVPVDKSGLLTPYIGLASSILAVAVSAAIYVRRVKCRKEKQ